LETVTAALSGFGQTSFSGPGNYHGRINVLRAILATWIAVPLIFAPGFAQAQTHSAASGHARAYYTRCPNIRYMGRHKLFRHALSCKIAKRKARYVLKNDTNPPGWRCSLDNLSDGYGACTRGRSAFEFLPL
jgi:hypothetical protein